MRKRDSLILDQNVTPPPPAMQREIEKLSETWGAAIEKEIAEAGNTLNELKWLAHQ